MNYKGYPLPHTVWHYSADALREANDFSYGALFMPSTVDEARCVYRSRQSELSALVTGVEDLGDGHFDTQRVVEVVPLGHYGSYFWDEMVSDLACDGLGIVGTIYCDGKGFHRFEFPEHLEQESGLSHVVTVFRCDGEGTLLPMLVIAAPGGQ